MMIVAHLRLRFLRPLQSSTRPVELCGGLFFEDIPLFFSISCGSCSQLLRNETVKNVLPVEILTRSAVPSPMGHTGVCHEINKRKWLFSL
jgi:hypothetical protein